MKKQANSGSLLTLALSVIRLVLVFRLPRMEKICVSIEVLLLKLGCFRLRSPKEVT